MPHLYRHQVERWYLSLEKSNVTARLLKVRILTPGLSEKEKYLGMAYCKASSPLSAIQTNLCEDSVSPESYNSFDSVYGFKGKGSRNDRS
ncbi:MAG: hypothetical protein ACU84J_14165, partial [Gammaproteobacteria bacterium]